MRLIVYGWVLAGVAFFLIAGHAREPGWVMLALLATAGILMLAGLARMVDKAP